MLDNIYCWLLDIDYSSFFYVINNAELWSYIIGMPEAKFIKKNELVFKKKPIEVVRRTQKIYLASLLNQGQLVKEDKVCPKKNLLN